MAETYASMELALDQIVYLLELELSVELDKITHERNDLIELPHPYSIKPAIKTIDQYPAVFVLPGMSKPQVLTSAGLIADHIVHIEAILAHDDSEILQRQRLRYLTAIKRVVLKPSRRHMIEVNGSQTAYSAEWLEDDYGDGLPALDQDTGQTVDSAAVRFTLQADEV